MQIILVYFIFQVEYGCSVILLRRLWSTKKLINVNPSTQLLYSCLISHGTAIDLIEKVSEMSFTSILFAKFANPISYQVTLKSNISFGSHTGEKVSVKKSDFKEKQFSKVSSSLFFEVPKLIQTYPSTFVPKLGLSFGCLRLFNESLYFLGWTLW